MTGPLEVLGLSAEQVRLNAGFFESYAKTCLRELDEPERWTVPDRIPERELSTSDPEWVLRIDAASALREAAHWTALSDPSRSAELLGHAGVEFVHLQLMFGVFLLRVGGFSPPARVPAEERAEMLGGALGMRPPPPRTPGSLAHPQQQAFVLLELASWGKRDLDMQVREMCERSAHRDGPTPVGALGAPIKHFWIMAEALAADSAELFLDHYVAAFGDRYKVALAEARNNAHLWRHGATRIDVIDPDALNVAVLATRRFGVGNIADTLSGRADLASDSALLVLLELGLQIGASTGAGGAAQ